MEAIETLKNIIRNNNMSTRPEYYSGRGATLTDLNGNILEGIYKGIEKDFGVKAAKNFVKMVADIKVLSATTFLEELYSLFNSNWKYLVRKKHASGISIPKNKDGEYDETSAISGMFGLMAAMTSGGRDDTMSIKGHFLSTHGVKPDKMKYDAKNGMSIWGY
jgi:hypothetical protein